MARRNLLEGVMRGERMTRDIEYSGTIAEFKPEDVEEIKKIFAAFHNTPISCVFDEIRFGDTIVSHKGGEEPIDAIKKHFGEFCRQHPHIEIEIMARYIEQTPCDIITIRDGEIEKG